MSPNRVAAAELLPDVKFPTHVGRLAVFENYEFMSNLGQGACGKVVAVRNRRTRQISACKVVSVFGEQEYERVHTEIALLKLMNHPNIMKLHEVYFEQDPACRASGGSVYLVTELCHGGDLLWRMAHHWRWKKRMFEIDVARIVRQVLYAIRYCHGLGVIHRDIKPANILFVRSSNTSPVKIIDFGLAAFTERLKQTARETKIPRSGKLGRLAQMMPTAFGKEILPKHLRRQEMQRAGTPQYMAPELIAGCYDQNADLFSVGIVLCELLTGTHPFFEPGVDSEEVVKAKIVSPEVVEWPKDGLLGEEISKEARDLCLELLRKDPRRRPSAGEALAHPWLRRQGRPALGGQCCLSANVSSPERSKSRSRARDISRPEAMYCQDTEILSTSDFVELAKYRAHNKLKRAVLQLMACELPESQAKPGQIEEEVCGKFMALDSDGDGFLSRDELAEGSRLVGFDLKPWELSEIVEAMDCSGSGRIGYQEFVSALVEQRLGFDEQLLRDCFAKFDASGSGCITYDAVRRVLCSGSGAAPGITESEWEEIVSRSGPADAPDGHSDSGAGCLPTLTLDAFMNLMQSEKDIAGASNSGDRHVQDNGSVAKLGAAAAEVTADIAKQETIMANPGVQRSTRE